MPVQIGDKRQQELTVTPDIAVHFMDNQGARVMGTPYLIYHLEITARNLVLPHLETGFDTVGTLVNVKHLAATPIGMKVTFHAEVIAIEDRLIRFRVEAFDEREKISDGIHERFIVNIDRFSARVQAKLK
ncbi:MAG: thioesterase family protein [Acidobacteriaceae bacterium]|nr:thioesterase family protein [Acidobacteriaceae bacterium]